MDVSPARGSNFWGPRESIFDVLGMRKFTFLKKRVHDGREI